MKNIVLVGLGAIGGVYAVAFKSHGIAFRVAMDAQRLERYSNEPFVFNDQAHRFDYFTPDAQSPKADLILITTKWNGYMDVLDLIEPLIGENTVILPLLNGISSERLAAERYGWDKVLYGYFVGHTATRDSSGKVTQDGSYTTVFGAKENDLSNLDPRVASVKELFDRAEVPYRVDDDMSASQWLKFVINIGTNQTTALYNESYGEVCSNPEHLKMARDLMDEAQSVALKLGISSASTLTERAMTIFDILEPEDRSSMAQDVKAARVTEVEMFAGELCRLGAEYAVPTPLNRKVLEYFRNKN